MLDLYYWPTPNGWKVSIMLAKCKLPYKLIPVNIGKGEQFAPEKVPYAIDRYGKEVDRLYGVLNTQLGKTGAFVAGLEYSIADMAIFPWVRTHQAQKITLDEFPHIQRWYDALFLRPAVLRGLDLLKDLRAGTMSEEARKALFGQTAQSCTRRRSQTHLKKAPHD